MTKTEAFLIKNPERNMSITIFFLLRSAKLYVEEIKRGKVFVVEFSHIKYILQHVIQFCVKRVSTNHLYKNDFSLKLEKLD